MGVKERLMEFIEYKNLGINEFQRSIEVSSSYVNNINKSIGMPVLRKISEVYPELNTEWLTLGTGEMIISANINKKNEVAVVPIAAQAGRLSDFTTSVYARDCERMISPIDDADFAIPVSGDSMEPEYTSGSRLLVKKINEKAFIDWGKTYVLDTCNGVIVKNIYPGSTEDCVRCVSINKNYPFFEVKYSDIYGWYRVLAQISLK